ncbi:MAG: hypothetical protein ABR970_08900 [Roseiarcus sp.]|jgi:hypothetical protein
MRKLLLLGTIGAAFAFGAAGAYAVPANSPYATFEPQAVDPGLTPDGQLVSEGRSAYVAGGAAYGLETGIPTPEDRTYYSRGK